MSLVYWLPMVDGTLKNQGLSDVAVAVNNGATVNSSGKLGKCFDFTGSTSSYIDTRYKEELGTGDFTLSAWFKLTDSGSRTYQPIISNKTTAAVSVGCAIYYNHTNGRFLWSTADGTNSSEVWGNSNASAYSTILNEWHHISMIRNSSDPKIGYFYLDGERIDLAAVPAIRNVTNTAGNMLVGRIHTSNVNYTWTGSLCDIRIYDHALSAREAKELSKGLVLHYPLNREGFGVDNICKNKDVDLSGSDYGAYNTRSYDADTHTGKIQVTDTNHVWNAWRFGSADLDTTCAELTTGVNTYTMSVDVKVTNYTTGTISCGFDFRTGGTVSKRATAVLTKEQCDGNWHRISATLTTNDEKNSQCLWSIGSSGTVHGSQTTIEYKNWKLERGDKATPWIPHKTDELYSKMGLNICNENLLSKSLLNPSNWTHIYPNCTRYTGDGYNNIFEMVTTSSYENVYLPVSVTSGQQYTLSLDYQVLDNFSLWQSSRPFSFQVLSAVPTNTDTFNNVLGSILVGNTAMSTPQRGSTTFTPTGDTVWLNIPGSYYRDGSSSYNKRVKFSYFKLEKGATATPWVSATSDPEKFGNTVFDTSGYRYNGAYVTTDETGSFIFESGSPRYNVAVNVHSLNATTNAKAGTAYIRGDCELITPNQLTVALWCYARSEGYGTTNWHGLFCTTNYVSGDQLGIDYLDSAMNHRDGKIDVNDSSASNHLRLEITVTSGSWHHYVFTYDGQAAKSYKDGVLQNTQTFSSASSLGSFKHVLLGLSRAGGVWRRNNHTYSDLRVYATALSAEDVLDLYQTSASLTSNGVLMASEFVES